MDTVIRRGDNCKFAVPYMNKIFSSYATGGTLGNGGLGGGGNSGSAGTPNTGGGGGASNNIDSGEVGGSGIVIVRYIN